MPGDVRLSDPLAFSLQVVVISGTACKRCALPYFKELNANWCCLLLRAKEDMHKSWLCFADVFDGEVGGSA